MGNKFKSREVFDSVGGSREEDPDTRALHLREHKERLVDDRLEAVLDRMDLDLLKNIYADHLRVFGIDPSQMNFLGPEAVGHF